MYCRCSPCWTTSAAAVDRTMSKKPSYHFGPMDPSSGEAGPSHVRRRPLDIPDAISQKFEVGRGPLSKIGNGFLYDFGGGNVYYSPNCNRPDVQVPSKVSTMSKSDPGSSTVAASSSGVLLGRDFNVDTFMQPQWWTRSQGFFAFTPRVLDKTTPTFRSLRTKPTVNEYGRSYCVDQYSLARWISLQDKMVNAVHLLRSCGVSIPSVKPAYPCVRLQRNVYKDRGEAARDIHSALGWFNVWAGLLAYSIAMLTVVARKADMLHPHTQIPVWMDALLHPSDSEERLDDIFVSDVSHVVAQYDGSIARVGTFIELPDTPNGYMISADWLVANHVPVWYAWGAREEGIAKLYPGVFDRFRPPKNALRVVGAPSPVNPLEQNATMHDASSIEHDPVSPSIAVPSRSKFEQRPAPTDAQLEVWSLAQRNRNAKREGKMVFKTDKERQLREAVEAQPPTSTKKVRFWVWTPDPTTGVYRSELADKEDAERMFSVECDYSRDQAEFDYFEKSWHVADFLGVPDDVQLERMANEAEEYYATPYELEIKWIRVWYGLDDVPEETPKEMKEHLLSVRDENTHRQEDEISGEAQTDDRVDEGQGMIDDGDDTTGTGDASDISAGTSNRHARGWHTVETTAYLLCGYLRPSTSGSGPMTQSRQGCSLVASLVGMGRSIHPGASFWTTNVGKALGHFGDQLIQAAETMNRTADMWDLSSSSREPITSVARFKDLRRLQGLTTIRSYQWDNIRGVQRFGRTHETRILWFESRSDRGWFLGCLSPSVALHICRLDPGQDMTAVAFDLLCRGFRIHTFLRTPPSWRIPINFAAPPSSHLARYRPCNHDWGIRDWESWEASLKIFLRTSRGRAAILRGGIVWRLAVDYLLPEEVLSGPSHRARRGEGFVMKDNQNWTYVDDELTAEEVDLICGVHYLYIGECDVT